VADGLAGAASGDENGNTPGGLLDRLRQRGAELAKGRRLVVPLPGWEDVGDGRGLWARFVPLSRSMQQAFAWTPDNVGQEIEVVAPMMAGACEEILIGTAEKRTPLADEPDISGHFGGGGPLRFDATLGEILGVGGDTPASVVKRMLVRGDDDLPFYGVWGELLEWSASVATDGIEVAAGE